MKKSMLLLAFFVLATRPDATLAQCKTYFSNKAGSVLTYDMKDSKNKPSGTYKIEIISANKNATEISAKTSFTPTKGQGFSSSPYTVKCQNGTMSMDVRGLMAGSGGQPFEAGVQASFVEFPSTMKAGQILPNAETTVQSKMNGAAMGEANIKISDRKVVGIGPITVPAGTFNAIQISSVQELKMKVAGISIPGSKILVNEWFVLGVGMVKQESEIKGGMMGRLAGGKSTMTLTSIK
ncbi:MAG: hypothetical protein JNN12_11275 [Bacteroidetes Order II. Incertae sedis bacterium]|nr:hypothetical protein [Bacteroidetes Order II. bacterium]